MTERVRFDLLVRAEREEIIADCALTPRERAVFEARAGGAGVVQTSMQLHLSEATVKRDTARVRAKIARAAHRRRGEREQAKDNTI